MPLALITAAENGSDENALIDNIPVRIVINVNKDASNVETNVLKGKKWIIDAKYMPAGETEMNRTGRVYCKTPARQKPAVEVSSPSTTLTSQSTRIDTHADRIDENSAVAGGADEPHH